METAWISISPANREFDRILGENFSLKKVFPKPLSKNFIYINQIKTVRFLLDLYIFYWFLCLKVFAVEFEEVLFSKSISSSYSR